MKLLTALLITLAFVQSQAQTPLLQTDFQAGIPVNYTLLNLDGLAPHPLVLEYASGWITTADPENNQDSVAAVSSYFENADTANRWLITPQLQLGSFGNFLSWEAKSHDPSFPDDYLVLLSTTTNDPAAFTDTIGYVQEENFEWTFREVNLSTQGYNDSTVYIAFVLRTYDGFKLYLDDIEVRKEDPVGLPEHPISTFNVYPNPSKEIINFQVNQDFQRIELTSTHGEFIRSTVEHSMNINDLMPGSYFVTVYSNGQRLTKRIIKI